MLLGRQRGTLGGQLAQGANNMGPGRARPDDRVHIAARGSHIGVGELLTIVAHLLVEDDQAHGVVGDGKPVTPVDLELACELSLEFRMRIDKLARLGEAVLLEDSSRCRIPLQAS